jgi:uncharacterized protein YifN (PemK superfamily)
MALQFIPHPGTVLICDYDLGRSAVMPPEMDKRRPVVVVSPRRRRVIGPFLVVPFSTSAPLHPDPTHHHIPAGTYDFLAQDRDSWAKCELVSAVAASRLDRLWNRGAYIAPRVSDADLHAVRLGMIHAIGAAPLLESG